MTEDGGCLTATYTSADAAAPAFIFQWLMGPGSTVFTHIDGRRSTLDEFRLGHPVAACGATLWPAAHLAIIEADLPAELTCATCARLARQGLV